jgi:hypothetical protein
MTTCNLAEVRAFTADVDARMDQCDNGEGVYWATIDATLKLYAQLCCEFTEGVRHWGREIFAGRLAFDPEVETVWRHKGEALRRRAENWLALGRLDGVQPCYELENLNALEAALGRLQILLDEWLTPKRALGPGARQGSPLSPAALEEARWRLDALPPLPADWEPDDPWQKAAFRRSPLSS